MRLERAAWLSFVTHALAAIGSLVLLRPGSPLQSDAAAREDYVAEHLWEWRLGWALWILATVALYVLLRKLAPSPARLVLVGLAFDVPSQLALAIPLGFEEIAYRGSGVVANGLYTLALYLALRASTLPDALRWSGLVVVALGVAVALAAIPLQPFALVATTGALSVAMVAWSFAVGVWARRASS